MNVFVLSTGRCGSQTFARACSHIRNFTTRHESNNIWQNPIDGLPYRDLRFPDQHIEVDNRLTWFLGALDREYGQSAYYVHLLRDRQEVARSLLRRGDRTILYGFAHSILQHYNEASWLDQEQRYQIALQFCDTVNGNIELFLRSRPRSMSIWLHDAPKGFTRFWREIGAEGDLDAACSEWGCRFNASQPGRAPLWCASPVAHDRAAARAARDLLDQVPVGAAFALLDQESLGMSLAPAGRRRIPFPGGDAGYSGPPEKEEALIAELSVVRSSGILFFVIAWPAFWWLTVYKQFARCLDESGRCLLSNQRLKVYAL